MAKNSFIPTIDQAFPEMPRIFTYAQEIPVIPQLPRHFQKCLGIFRKCPISVIQSFQNLTFMFKMLRCTSFGASFPSGAKFHLHFTYERQFGSFSLVVCLVTFCNGKKFRRKMGAYNVDEIDLRGTISSTFYVQLLRVQSLKV